MRSAVALCLLALVVTGCGTATSDSAKSFKGDQQKVAAVVEALEKAARDNKPDTVCTKLLTAKLLAAIVAQGTNCKTGTKEAFEDADSFDLTVKNVTISGTNATAKVSAKAGSENKTYTLAFALDGGAWKIASLQ